MRRRGQATRRESGGNGGPRSWRSERATPVSVTKSGALDLGEGHEGGPHRLDVLGRNPIEEGAVYGVGPSCDGSD